MILQMEVTKTPWKVSTSHIDAYYKINQTHFPKFRDKNCQTSKWCSQVVKWSSKMEVAWLKPWKRTHISGQITWNSYKPTCFEHFGGAPPFLNHHHVCVCVCVWGGIPQTGGAEAAQEQNEVPDRIRRRWWPLLQGHRALFPEFGCF